VLAAYLGSTLRYDVEMRAGVCSRWMSVTRGTTRCCRRVRPVCVTFPASAALTLPDE